MAVLTIKLVLSLIITSIISFLVLQQCDAQQVLRLQVPRLKRCKIDKIYQFGDSLSDVGNCMRESRCRSLYECKNPPYGMNLLKKLSIGPRCSNGFLIIDFLALECDLPLLNPYKDQHANFRHGVNFAVAGASALPAEILTKNNIANPMTNSSLYVQLDWMSSHFKTTCSTDCPGYLKNSLFVVGEIGQNEIGFGLSEGKSIEKMKSMVPEIIQTISNGVKKIIDFGATRILVPGDFPVGCFPRFLAQFMTENSTAYDEYHCFKDLNNLAFFYNFLLQQAIEELKKENPNIALVYGDYYNAYMWILQNAVNLGFDQNYLDKSCCGVGGPYNFSASHHCGNGKEIIPVCPDPTTYISWDGEHLTERAYSLVTSWLIDDILPKFNC